MTILWLNLSGIEDAGGILRDSEAESVGYRGRPEGYSAILKLNLSGIRDDRRDT